MNCAAPGCSTAGADETAGFRPTAGLCAPTDALALPGPRRCPCVGCVLAPRFVAELNLRVPSSEGTAEWGEDSGGSESVVEGMGVVEVGGGSD